MVSVAKTLGAVEGCGGPGCHRVFGVLDISAGVLGVHGDVLVYMATPFGGVGGGGGLGGSGGV